MSKMLETRIPCYETKQVLIVSEDSYIQVFSEALFNDLNQGIEVETSERFYIDSFPTTKAALYLENTRSELVILDFMNVSDALKFLKTNFVNFNAESFPSIVINCDLSNKKEVTKALGVEGFDQIDSLAFKLVDSASSIDMLSKVIDNNSEYLTEDEIGSLSNFLNSLPINKQEQSLEVKVMNQVFSKIRSFVINYSQKDQGQEEKLLNIQKSIISSTGASPKEKLDQVSSKIFNFFKDKNEDQGLMIELLEFIESKNDYLTQANEPIFNFYNFVQNALNLDDNHFTKVFDAQISDKDFLIRRMLSSITSDLNSRAEDTKDFLDISLSFREQGHFSGLRQESQILSESDYDKYLLDFKEKSFGQYIDIRFSLTSDFELKDKIEIIKDLKKLTDNTHKVFFKIYDSEVRVFIKLSEFDYELEEKNACRYDYNTDLYVHSFSLTSEQLQDGEFKLLSSKKDILIADSFLIYKNQDQNQIIITSENTETKRKSYLDKYIKSLGFEDDKDVRYFRAKIVDGKLIFDFNDIKEFELEFGAPFLANFTMFIKSKEIKVDDTHFPVQEDKDFLKKLKIGFDKSVFN